MIQEVCVLGAGFAGIYSLKYLLDNDIKDVIVFEKDYVPGGIWTYTSKPGGVLKNCHATSSVFYMHPSDYPFPDTTPVFPHHSLVKQHLLNYIENFKLSKYIKYNTPIIKVTKNNDLWEVITETDEKYLFKKIILATGSSQIPADIPDMYRKFTKEIYHSHYFKDNAYKDKTILVVGGGESSSDISSELCNDNKLYISVSNGIWYQDRIFGANFPTDMLYNRFIHNCFKKWFINKVVGENCEAFWGKCGSGLKIWETNESGFLNSFYNKARDVIQWIAQGKIIPKKKVTGIIDNLVTFDDLTSDYFDVIILAIGYNLQTPILEKYYNFDYLHIFDPTDTSIALCGGIRPYVGSIPMILEFQAELIAMHFANKIRLPKSDDMTKDIQKSKKKQLKEFKKDAPRIKRIIDPFDYANKLTAICNTRPNAFKIFFTDIYLWFQFIFNPYTLFSYRLTHPDKNKRKIAYEYMKKYQNHEVAIRGREISCLMFVVFYLLTPSLFAYIIYKIFGFVV